MSRYILRLDDASDYMDNIKWKRMEELLDKYAIKPLVGIIPDNRDDDLVGTYEQNLRFWEKVSCWQNKGWILALHGCYHKYTTQEGGINPINNRSEFAGIPFDRQCIMIRHGIEVFKSHNITPKIFFAPSHTFDENTLHALEVESDIRIISDTIANDVYFEDGFFFVPQQSGQVRKLPFKVCTFCYHPNMMKDEDFDKLEEFIKKYQKKFTIEIEEILKERKKGLLDLLLKKLYFVRRK